MDTSISSLVRIAMELAPQQRVELAARLLAGIDPDAAAPPPAAPMVDRLWAMEIDFRIVDADDRNQIDPTWEELRGMMATPAGRQVRLVPKAQAELRALIEQYQRTRPLLVALLFESLDEMVWAVRGEGDAMPRAPMTNPLKRVRRAAVRGFPYHLLFHDDSAGDVRILALARAGRAPA